MIEEREGSGASRRFVGIEIPADLKWSNFFNMYLATFFIACLLIVPAVLQPALLKEVINIPEEQAGSINAGLQNMHYVATLLFIVLVGILSDKVGRRILAIIGFAACGVFYILFGYTKEISLAQNITLIPVLSILPPRAKGTMLPTVVRKRKTGHGLTVIRSAIMLMVLLRDCSKRGFPV